MNLKLELFHLRKAFLEYHQGFKYFKNRYFLAKKIFNSNKIFERPINNDDLSIHILTQHKDMTMLVWSLASLYKSLTNIGQLYIHNDGSLTEADQKIIKKFFPSANILNTEKFLEDHNNQLENYPVIKKFRQNYQYLKKLIDPYFASAKPYRLIVDSDLIWFKTPIELEQEIKNGCHHSFMQENYTINRTYNIRFKHGQLEDNLAKKNSGIVLYHKQNFDLQKLTEYFDKVDTDYKNNYHFIEQAGYAYCLTNLDSLPTDKYIIKDEISAVTVMKHYTSPRRALFYIEGLEKIKENFL